MEENVARSIKMLHRGLRVGRDIKLDGFVFEVEDGLSFG